MSISAWQVWLLIGGLLPLLISGFIRRSPTKFKFPMWTVVLAVAAVIIALSGPVIGAVADGHYAILLPVVASIIIFGSLIAMLRMKNAPWPDSKDPDVLERERLRRSARERTYLRITTAGLGLVLVSLLISIITAALT